MPPQPQGAADARKVLGSGAKAVDRERDRQKDPERERKNARASQQMVREREGKDREGSGREGKGREEG